MSENSYDSVRYPGHAYRDSHVSHLHTLGLWWGLQPAAPDDCSVLEIGCGDGANLLPMAQQYPASRFLGIDLAAEPVAAARRLADVLELRNLELRSLDLRELAPAVQSFDYIIAHGLYSWVEAPVREAVLALMQRALKPQGIAFVSYNCYPGCHRRAEVWEMLRFHVEGLEDPAQRLAEARALAALLHDACSHPDLPARALQIELERVLRASDGGLFHDDLALVNQPLYFHEFIAQAGGHGLQFLGEADLASMGLTGLSVEARAMLQSVDPLAREQYLDFMRERRFRQTLLCPDAAEPRRSPGAAHLLDFHLAIAADLGGLAGPGAAEAVPPAGPVGIEGMDGGSADAAALFDLLRLLRDAHPRTVPVPVLLRELQARHVPMLAQASLLRIMQGALMSGVLRLHAQALELPAEPGERPCASTLARAQLALDPAVPLVTTLRHEMVALDAPQARALLPLLDGSRGRAELLAGLNQTGLDAAALDAHLRTLAGLALLSA